MAGIIQLLHVVNAKGNRDEAAGTAGRVTRPTMLSVPPPADKCLSVAEAMSTPKSTMATNAAATMTRKRIVETRIGRLLTPHAS